MQIYKSIILFSFSFNNRLTKNIEYRNVGSLRRLQCSWRSHETRRNLNFLFVSRIVTFVVSWFVTSLLLFSIRQKTLINKCLIQFFQI
jgi:hypothetical protein